ncbi:S-adenosyl-L-methionine-dependent methyltransferase [Glomus cerebriforme]|uniref:S-adenosyl-L-methionine-dependent methyltransferase n=1 Tax=Glomus cerebriforme TaxID=658196 RepID=A0A397SI85_9GLOM|nr:S-adenosyl-L-methionine-dependent methyltransferase [Glomus cerebriforme]
MGKSQSKPPKSSRNNNSTPSTIIEHQKIYKPHNYYVPLPPPNNKIFQYKGNRRHTNISNVNYLFPVDDNENDRIQDHHYIYRYIWDNNFSAPIEELLDSHGSTILDIGCGPATWTLEVATEYPRSRFTGIDIAPTYPIHTKPHNVEFLQANILTGLPYADNTFDYVFCRFMIFAFTLEDWKLAIKEICRVCKVGGYIEFMEKDILFWNEGNFTRRARLWLAEELRKKKNVEIVISPKIQQFISETKHFPIIYHAERSVPIGEWGGNLGKCYEYNYKWGAKNLKNAIIKDCGNGDADWDMIVDKCVKELSENHGYDKVHRIWARKEELQDDVESTIIQEE